MGPDEYLYIRNPAQEVSIEKRGADEKNLEHCPTSKPTVITITPLGDRRHKSTTPLKLPEESTKHQYPLGKKAKPARKEDSPPLPFPITRSAGVRPRSRRRRDKSRPALLNFPINIQQPIRAKISARSYVTSRWLIERAKEAAAVETITGRDLISARGTSSYVCAASSRVNAYTRLPADYVYLQAEVPTLIRSDLPAGLNSRLARAPFSLACKRRYRQLNYPPEDLPHLFPPLSALFYARTRPSRE